MSPLHVVRFHVFLCLFWSSPFCSMRLCVSVCTNTTLLMTQSRCVGGPEVGPRKYSFPIPLSEGSLLLPPECTLLGLVSFSPWPCALNETTELLYRFQGSTLSHVASLYIWPRFRTHDSTQELFAESEWKCLERPNAPSRVCLWTSPLAAPEIAPCLFIQHVFVQLLLCSC